MDESGIGVRQILPHSGTRWQDSHPGPQRRDDDADEGGSHGETERAPPQPGTGEIVDRVV